MQAIETNQEEEEIKRPVFVKSTNFRNSVKMDPKNYDAPPTDRQIKYLQNLGYAGEIPTTRKQASDIITSLLKQQNNGNGQ